MAWKVFYYNTRLKLVISVLNWPKICGKINQGSKNNYIFFVVFVSFCYNKEKKQHIVKSNNKYKNKTIIMKMMMMIFASSLLNSRQFTCEVHFNKKSWNDSNILAILYFLLTKIWTAKKWKLIFAASETKNKQKILNTNEFFFTIWYFVYFVGKKNERQMIFMWPYCGYIK